jgi:hypothetical protein
MSNQHKFISEPNIITINTSVGQSIIYDTTNVDKTLYTIIYPDNEHLSSIPNNFNSNTGLFISDTGSLGISSNGVNKYTINKNDHIFYVGETLSSTALRLTTAGNITYIQNSELFDSSLSSPLLFSFQTLRISPYFSTIPIVEIQRNLFSLGSPGDLNTVNLDIVNGILKINGTQVITKQQDPIADIDQTLYTMNDMVTLQKNISDINIKINMILNMLRIHGLISR